MDQPASQPVTVTPVYASVGRRWVASVLDGLILGVAGFIIGLPFTVVGSILGSATSAASGDTSTGPLLATGISSIGSLINLVVGVVYYVYFIGKSGQTLGKKALGIKVIKISGEPSMGYANAFLRETVGKFASAIVFGLGYLWAIWDPRKQAWHDKIAGTIVIKV